MAELYDGEKQLIRFLPKMAKALPTPELRDLLETHARETEVQCQRLQKLMSKRGVEETKKSKAMSGILAEAKELLKQQAANPVLSLALVSAAQEVAGHEITGYACAHSFARLLGFHQDLKPIEDTFHEEKKMEQRLAALAESLGIEELDSEEEVHATGGGSS